MGIGFRRWMLHAASVALTSCALTVPSVASATPAHQPPTVVPGCENACETAFSIQFPDNVRFEGLRGRDSAGLPVSYLAYWVGDDLRDARQIHDADNGWAYEWADTAACGYNGNAQRCSVSFGTGAHGGAVASVLLLYNEGIVVSDTVLGGAGDTRVADLTGDGRADAAVTQSTYEPSYADAPQYWETYREQDGQFARTECTTPTKQPQQTPDKLVHGPCP